MKLLKAFVFLLFLGAGALQAKGLPIYQITQIQSKADIDKKMVRSIDSYPIPYPKKGAFQIGDIKTTRGRYTVYKFVHSFYGRYHEAKRDVVFHKLLVIKARGQKIIAAYHYSPEWQDSPSLRFYKMTAKGLSLRKELTLADFKFRNSQKEALRDTGVLDDYYRGRKMFVSAARRIPLTINGNELRIKGKYVLFEPNRNVRRAYYDTYFFEKGQFLKKFGSIKKIKRLKATCVLKRKKKRTYKPKRGQSPRGGFRITEFFCGL